MNHNEWMKNSGFCKRLKQARQAKHLSLVEAASLVEGRFTAGILESIENGAICPSVGRVVELARIYGCSMDWLCGLAPADWSKDGAT